MTAHVSKRKQETAAEFQELLMQYPIVAAVNIEGLPAKQFQNMREKLRESCVIRVAKRRVMTVAINAVKDKKQGIDSLTPHLAGMPALLFTKQNPFTLYKTIKKNKSKAAAKAGQKAPNEIIVRAGPTPFAPGPIIGELGSVGIKSGVDAGKIAIKQDAVVAKPGDIISQKLAGILTRLGIEPMEVGLDVTAVYEDGMIITKDVLNVDEDAYLGMLTKAAAEAIAISIEAGYLTTETRERGIQQAARSAAALALETKTEGLNLSDAERALYEAIIAGPITPTAGAADSAAPAAEAKKEEKTEETAAEGLAGLFG